MPARLVEQSAQAASKLTSASKNANQSQNHQPGSGYARSVLAAHDNDAGDSKNADPSNCSFAACPSMLQGAAWLAENDAEKWTAIFVRSQFSACHQGRVQPNMEPRGPSSSTAVKSIHRSCGFDCPIALQHDHSRVPCIKSASRPGIMVCARTHGRFAVCRTMLRMMLLTCA